MSYYRSDKVLKRSCGNFDNMTSRELRRKYDREMKRAKKKALKKTRASL